MIKTETVRGTETGRETGRGGRGIVSERGPEAAHEAGIGTEEGDLAPGNFIFKIIFLT